MQTRDIILVPNPKKIDFKPGSFLIKKEEAYISIPVEDRGQLFFTAKRIQKVFEDNLRADLHIMVGKRGAARPIVTFERDNTIPDEGYLLEINPDGICISYSYGAGAFNAVSTLKQLIHQCGDILPCLRITDEPDFKTRGIMLDISRNKIPSMDTLFKMVDFTADLKINQLQLYIEGFSFAYQSYPDVWKHGTPVTGEEIMELDRYCRDRFIELVPNQNSFGHMDAWLAREEFKDMAECPGGFQAPWGKYEKASVLNPLDPRSIELVRKMYDDLLPYFSSRLFNVGCDETFELGQGKSKELCKKIGTGRVYLDFLIKLYELVKEQGRRMMFWGDIIVQHPELVPELPKDIIAIAWGYNPDQPSREDCEKFGQTGIPFYVCPGTASWNSITGKMEQMKANLLTAAINGKEYGAIGFLNADWGDNGHWQYLPVSYAGLSYGAALSWGVEQNKDIDIAAYLNRFIFCDRNNIMGGLVLKLGNYYLKEKKSVNNLTNIAQILYSDLEDMSPVDDAVKEDFLGIMEFVDILSEELDETDMQCDDVELIYAEYRNAIRFVKHGINLGIFKLSNYDDSSTKLLLKEMIKEINSIIDNHKVLWLKRNRIGGLEDSIHKLKKLKSQYLVVLEG